MPKNTEAKTTDPVAVVCQKCGTANSYDRAEGVGDELGHCHECNGFLPRPTREQTRLFYKRVEQTVLYDEGYVTVGGYVAGVHADG